MKTSEPSDHMRRLFRDDERHVWSTKPNAPAFLTAVSMSIGKRVTFLAVWGIPFFGIFGFVSLSSFAPSLAATIESLVRANLPLAIGGVLAAVFLVNLVVSTLVGYLRYHHAEYALTDDRVIATSGLVGRDSSTVSLKDVRDVNVNVGILDKIFGTGDIQVQVAGGGLTDLPMGAPNVDPSDLPFSGVAITYVDDPYDVVDTIEDARKKAEDAAQDGAD